MDLRAYLDTEGDEGSDRVVAGPDGSEDGYPGDPAVHVREDEVSVRELVVARPGSQLLTYLALPLAPVQGVPAVVVVHENKGLVPYIKDVVRRLTARGYVAVAPDLLSRFGGTESFADPADVALALKEIPDSDVVADVRAVIEQLAGLAEVDADRIGILGFCYGGGVAWRVLTEEPRLRAGVPFYGPTPEPSTVPGIQAPVLAVFGELDERITSQLPGIREVMAANGKAFEAMVCVSAPHAFHNDTNAERYHPEAAREAWAATLAHLDEHLGGA